MAQPTPIRILLVDDHSVVRMGLAAILGLDEELCVVAEAEDAAQALEKFKAERPDIVLMDVRMPGVSGIHALRSLRAAWPSARVLMLTTSELDEDIQQAIAAGACGYLPKSVKREELAKAIRQVHAGGHYIPEAMASRLERFSCRTVVVHPPSRPSHCPRSSRAALRRKPGLCPALSDQGGASPAAPWRSTDF